MHSRLLVSGLPRSLPSLPPSPAPPCLPCVEGRQRAAPHSSSFPPTTAPLQTLHMDVWGPARVSRQGRERYFLQVVDDYMRYTMVFPLCSKGEVPDVLIPWIHAVRLQLRERFCEELPVLRLHSDRGASPQQNGIAERRIGLVMEVACTSMILADAPHFLLLVAVRYAAHQLNLWSRVSLPETSPTLRWTGEVGDASVFRDVTFDESVPFHRLFPYRSAPPPPPPLFLALGPPPVDPLPPQGPTPSGVSQVDPLPGTVSMEVADGSGAVRGAASGGATSGSAEPGGVESEGAGFGGAEPGGAEPGGAEPGGAEHAGSKPGGAESEGAESGGAEPRVVGARVSATGDTGVGAVGVTDGAGGTGGATAAGHGGARMRGTRAAGTGSVGGAGAGGAGAGDPAEPGGSGAGGTSAGGARAGGAGAGNTGAVAAGARGTGAGARGARAGDTRTVDPGAGGAGAGGAVSGSTGGGGTVRPRPYFVPLVQQSQPPLQLASPLPTPSPYTEQTGGLTERREPESRPTSPVRAVCTGCRIPRLRPPPIPDTHAMVLRPSSFPLRVPLPPPPESSLPAIPDTESNLACAASPTVSRLLATLDIDPSFESTAASALVAELVDFAAACRLDYATALVAESESDCPPSVGGECAFGTDVLESRQQDLECLASTIPRFASMLLAPKGDTDAPVIPTLRSYAEAITGPYSSQWQAAMDAKMASWKSTGTFVDAVPASRANIVDGMWIFRRDYELHSLDFNTAFLQGSLHEEIWLRRPPGFTGSFPAGLHLQLWGSLFLCTDTSLPPFYVLVYIDDLVFATADTEALTFVKARRTIALTLSHTVHQVLQRFGFQFSLPQPTPLSTGHSLSAPPSDESVEPSGSYPELVGCLMYLMTCTGPDLAYPLSLLARYVAPGRHRK
ncbi:unnamed protein product, partial [Closterium sp. NIES-53]